LPSPAEDFVLFQDFRRDPRRHPLQTPSGRIELYSETLARLDLSDCGPHPRWLPPVEWLGASRRLDYPLHLISVQPGDRLHSQLDYAPLSQAGKTAACERMLMHPEDAAERGLQEGERVRVHNERGACLAGLALRDGLMRGVVIMATGAWFDPDPEPGRPERGGNVNVLTLDIGSSELTQGPNAMSCMVEVTKA
jgi:biotin/methionine sulfoxide reductase